MTSPQLGIVPRVTLEDIREGVSLYFREGVVYEVRVLLRNNKRLSGYFENAEALAQAVYKMARSPTEANFYLTMNPVNPDLLARAHNRIVPALPSLTTSDKDIQYRTRFVFDCDAKRPSGISATEEEHQHAAECADQAVEALCSDFGWPNPIRIDSGNGYHLTYAVDLPNDDDSEHLLKAALKAADGLFSTATAEIDKAIFNAARLIRIPGTVARKGDSLPERPHRLCRLLSPAAEPPLLSREQLSALADRAPQPERRMISSGNGKPFTGTVFDVEEFLRKHDIDYLAPVPWEGGEKFVLEHCPFHPDHAAPDAAVFRAAAGTLGFKCFHNSCVDHDWHALRTLLEGPREYRIPSTASRQAAPQTGISLSPQTTEENPSLPAASAAALPPKELVWIEPSNQQLRDTTSQCLAALREANTPPSLFTQDDKMVRIQVQGGPPAPVVARVREDGLRGYLSRVANFRHWIKVKKGAPPQFVQDPPPKDVAKDILALPPEDWGFPFLAGLVGTPVLRPDGSILDQPGYDPTTKLYYAPADGLAVHVPESPTQEDARQAALRILEVIRDFRWADERASRANMLAAFLGPVCRPAIPGSFPIALINAHQQGTGKTLAADCVGWIVSGASHSLTAAPKNDEEWGKKLTSILIERPALVIFDNVNYPLSSGDLCLALTAGNYSDRVLGRSANVHVPVQWCCMATGNNLQLGGDMARRAYWINQDAKCAKPFLRKDFKHADLKEWVLENRGSLLGALLTMARAWFVAGKPAAPEHRFGGFQAWTDTIGGILHHAGMEGFLENAEKVYEEADIESSQWESFLLCLKTLFPGGDFLCSEIAKLAFTATYNDLSHQKELTSSAERLVSALPDAFTKAAGQDAKALSAALGLQFRQRLKRRFGSQGVYLDHGGKVVHKTQTWKVEVGGMHSPQGGDQ